MRHSLVLLPLLLGCAAVPPSSDLQRAYEAGWAPRLVPMLIEVVRFPTYAGNAQAFVDQKAWLARTARELGFTFNDAGPVSEIELAGPPGAPVLGLVVHGDVVPVSNNWTFPPFEAVVRDGMVLGRGTADDKGPLVQALLAMMVLKENPRPRTYAIRLLVGSDEETGSADITKYLESHKAPDLSLVLDSNFPVVVGEMSGNAFSVDARLEDREAGAFRLTSIAAGIASNIVPDLAIAKVEALAGGEQALQELQRRLESRALPDGIRVETELQGSTLVVRTRGKAAHAGVNAAGGRNSLVAMASLLSDELPKGGARDLLAFTRLAGQDLHGTGLGLTETHPVFGRAVVVPTVARITPEGGARLLATVRSHPDASGDALKARLMASIRGFNARTGASLVGGGGFTSKPLVHDVDSKIVKRLLAAYARGTGKAEPPAISAGGTYAKRLPNSIVFGMWFPGKPYPGHDIDEQISVADLHKGVRVLLEGISDIVYNEPMTDPFKPGPPRGR